MDAPEEESDIKLQRVSSELIAAFDKRLEPFLRKPDGSGGSRVRSRVRAREAYHLTFHLLDPFQELPQLLDPHLPRWLPLLAEAFLEHLQTRRRRAREASSAATSTLLMPLPTAICKLIYTLCKIRGEKVVVRFLSVETRYLELLLSALEEAERHEEQKQAGGGEVAAAAASNPGQWAWEERYVVLLWLSHLMFAPFDLSTISSVYMEDVDLAGIQGFFWPSNVPGITVRILPLAVKYLACPGKERDAAKALLVRMAMRRDMQQLGVLHALVQWALFWLRPREGEPAQSPYKYIGVLAFLAGILASSAETSDMDKYSATIFYTVSAIPSNDDEMSRIVKSSALAKKIIIKAMRSIAVVKLKREKRDMAGIELVETTIGHLLESLADNDTPVRLAASKALSIVTLRLPADMASEIVEAVLEALNKNVLLVQDPKDSSLPPTRDLTSADPLEWQGLMLTLSHLLYRRSPPADNLGAIIRALLLGLAFERRSPSGVSVGTNVRDAACFGVWALARRYSTRELLAVPSCTVRDGAPAETSVLQMLATDLVVAASLDPAGNIRRGSSAALQELIGRHPDTVAEGIALVQAVDYHTVALRSRAIHDVAVSATRLHAREYGDAILAALLGWRGVGDADAAARRVAGRAYGTVTSERMGLDAAARFDEVMLASMSRVLRSLEGLQIRQVEERHGLLLALASILDQLPLLVARERRTRAISPAVLGQVVEAGQSAVLDVLRPVQSTVFRKPELVAESICRLLVSFFPIIQAEAVGYDNAIDEGLLVPGPDLMSASDVSAFTRIVSKIDSSQICDQIRLSSIFSISRELVDNWLTKTETEVILATSEASVVVLLFSSPEQCEEIIHGWASTVQSRSRSGTASGFFCALTRAFPVVALSTTPKEASKTICGPLLARWAQETQIEVRVAILQSLVQSEVLRVNTEELVGLISEGLEDYTTNARGDVGSHVRLQAIKATKYLWTTLQLAGPEGSHPDEVVVNLLRPILRLAAEKLDRVRVEAQATLALALRPESSSQLRKLTFSSQSYFHFLLDLLTAPDSVLHDPFAREARSSPAAWMDELLAGYVTSADTGNEELVIASRAALTTYCKGDGQDAGADQARIDGVCGALVRNLKARRGQAQQDRVVVPTLEIVAFLFSVGLWQRASASAVDLKSLCLQVQRVGYKSGNVRKIEACVKVYGGVAAMGGVDDESDDTTDGGESARRSEAVAEAKRRLGALLLHPWPRVRSSVVDELWRLSSPSLSPSPSLAGSGGGETDRREEKAAQLKGVDWATAEKGALKTLVADLGLS